MSYITLTIFLALSVGLIINYIIINRKPKRQDYSEHYERLAKRHIERLEEQREKERPCDEWTEEEFWAFINPIAERANGSFFNFVSLLKDRSVRKEKQFLLELDNTFLALSKPHATQLNQNIAKRLFPNDDWYFLTYMTFLMCKGEQRFNWLASYPHDLFKHSFEVNADISISGICGHAWYKQFREFIPAQCCIDLPDHALWNDERWQQEKPELFKLLIQVQTVT
jgi:hypothetical protein